MHSVQIRAQPHEGPRTPFCINKVNKGVRLPWPEAMGSYGSDLCNDLYLVPDKQWMLWNHTVELSAWLKLRRLSLFVVLNCSTYSKFGNQTGK